MSIQRIEVKNFKCFDDLDIELGKLNVLIGANASGKSNFINIFKFLRDITNHGLDNAISMQGGVEYLRNLRIGSSEDLYFRIHADSDYKWIKDFKKLEGLEVDSLIYEFKISFNKRGLGYKVVEDRLEKHFRLVKLEKMEQGIKETELLAEGRSILNIVNRKVKHSIDGFPKDIPFKEDVIFPSIFRHRKIEDKSLISEQPFFMFPTLDNVFEDVSIFDFDPRISKKACPIISKSELSEDGNNVAFILKNIIKDNDKKRKFNNLIKDILVYFVSIGTKKLLDKSIIFTMKEIYKDDTDIPSSLISDGTINIIAFIISLYFNKKPITIIEEPERNIHPHLISKVVEMMKDASQNKQIIVTTHNPEMVKHADLDDVLLVSRNEDGFAEINRPGEKKEIQTFLENEMGLEELFVDDLLNV